MPALTPITQRDVARICGVHPSTICLALKNSPSIPAETRRRIQAAAGELGYHPNAAARNLAFLRTDKKSVGTLPIAWINQEAARDHWRTNPAAAVYYDSADRRAAALGYHLEDIWLREPGMNVARLIQIIRARGIEGVIFAAHEVFDFAILGSAWSGFATIGFNDLRLGEWIDLVCPDYFRNTALMLNQLRRQGHRRIGMVLSAQFDAASNGLAHSCFLRDQCEVAMGQRIPVYFAEGCLAERTATLTHWLLRHQPDAVICEDPALMEWARQAHPFQRWIRSHTVGRELNASVDEHAAEIAVAAVDTVVEKMRFFEKEWGGSTQLQLIQGTWLEPSSAVRNEAINASSG